jgi:hypothetical protein
MCILFLLRSLSLFSFSVFIRPRIMKHEQNLQWLHFISVPFHLCFSRAHVENIWVVNARGNGILLIICLCFSSAKLLLEELHILEEDVYSTTLKACLSSLRHMDDCPDDNSLTNIFSEVGIPLLVVLGKIGYIASKVHVFGFIAPRLPVHFNSIQSSPCSHF